jgi:hypothetical protein
MFIFQPDGIPDDIFSVRRQHPQCEGANASRIIFTRDIPNRQRVLFKATASAAGIITLDAGEVNGITSGAILDIYATTEENAPVLGQLVVQEPGTLTTVLKKVPDDDFQMPTTAWASITPMSSPTVNVAVAKSDGGLFSLCSSVVEQMKTSRTGRCNVRLVDNDHPHEITTIHNTDGQVVFDVDDHICRSFELQRLRHSTPLNPSSLQSVLGPTADFFYHLRRSYKRTSLSQHLTLQAHILEEYYPQSTDMFPALRPIGENLIVGGVMLPKVFISGEEDDHDHEYYGFKIVSAWNKPLYVWMFAFEMNDLCIG